MLREAVVGWNAWMSGIRRDQSSDRAGAPIVGWDKKFGLVKISPLANWTKKDVWKLITDENIPYNPLHDQGYTSIGCWPCTRAVMFGEDERAGRWSGTGQDRVRPAHQGLKRSPDVRRFGDGRGESIETASLAPGPGNRTIVSSL